jgi:hypothetical protein
MTERDYGPGRGVKYVNYRPWNCQRCNGEMTPIPGNQAWKCKDCGLEVWLGDGIPTFEECHDMLHSSPKEVMRMGGAIKKGGGSKSGKRRKKPRKLTKNYYFEYRNTKTGDNESKSKQ